MTGKMTIALLKREAELYRTQGLHREAINVYEKILETGSTLDPEVRQAAQCRVDALAQELRVLEPGPGDAISPAEVDSIRGGWKDRGDACDPYNCARVFREMGLFEEALAEYAKLYQPLRPAPDALAGLCECLSRCCAPASLPQRFARLLVPHGLDVRETADAQFDLAATAEKKGFAETALALYRAVHRIAPDYPGLRRRLDELAGRGKCRLALGALWGRLGGPLVSDNGACRGFPHRLRLLLAALANRLRAKAYPAARP
jgi:tetratricopeptide (TPR) repeat protein